MNNDKDPVAQAIEALKLAFNTSYSDENNLKFADAIDALQQIKDRPKKKLCPRCEISIDYVCSDCKDQQAQPVEQEARLLNELAEAARCQGVAQAKNDKHANEYWTKKVDALVSSGYITDAQQAQPVDKQKREFGGIEWELVYMPAGWTSIIDELIFAHKGEKYLEFRTTLAAAPRYAPVEQAHGAMPDYWVREDILFKLNDSRKVLIETHESANEFTNCTYQGKHVYKVTALYTSPTPSPQADKEVVAKLEELRDAGYSPDWSFVIATVSNMLKHCDTAEPSGLCRNCIADGKCMKRQAMCVANGTAKEQGRDDE